MATMTADDLLHEEELREALEYVCDDRWIDAGGREWMPGHMTTEHLVNAIRHGERFAANAHRDAVEESMGAASAFGIDTMAAYYSEQGLDDLMRMDPVDYVRRHTVVGLLRFELKRRGRLDDWEDEV